MPRSADTPNGPHRIKPYDRPTKIIDLIESDAKVLKPIPLGYVFVPQEAQADVMVGFVPKPNKIATLLSNSSTPTLMGSPDSKDASPPSAHNPSVDQPYIRNTTPAHRLAPQWLYVRFPESEVALGKVLEGVWGEGQAEAVTDKTWGREGRQWHGQVHVELVRE